MQGGHGQGSSCSPAWLGGLQGLQIHLQEPNKLQQCLGLTNATLGTAGFIDFAESIAIFINHL